MLSEANASWYVSKKIGVENSLAIEAKTRVNYIFLFDYDILGEE